MFLDRFFLKDSSISDFCRLIKQDPAATAVKTGPVVSMLQIHFFLVRAGKIAFRYRVSAEEGTI